MPFWRLLSNQSMDMDDVKDSYSSLRRRIRDFFVIEHCEDSDFFWRSAAAPNEFLKFLQSECVLESWYVDVLTASLTLIREAEIAQNPKRHIEALHLWIACRDLIDKESAFKGIEHDIHDLVYDKHFRKNYFLNGTYHKWEKRRNGAIELVAYKK